jgi:hypothetical protein
VFSGFGFIGSRTCAFVKLIENVSENLGVELADVQPALSTSELARFACGDDPRTIRRIVKHHEHVLELFHTLRFSHSRQKQNARPAGARLPEI